MKKNKGVKIMAFLALFGIIIGIAGTGLLIIFSDTSITQNTQEELTPEKIKELQELFKSGSKLNQGSGVTIGSGELK